MRLFLFITLILPVAAYAQAPVAPSGQIQPQPAAASPAPAFPDWAVTTGGKETTPPPAPGNAAPAAPVPATPQAPVAPGIPVSPTAPVSDIWPADTVPVFVRRCAMNRVELVAICRCTIETVMKGMTHREFLALSEKNAVAQDARYINARQTCATPPGQR
jgi:hypothetical protein